MIRGMPGDVLPIYKCHAEPLGFAEMPWLRGSRISAFGWNVLVPSSEFLRSRAQNTYLIRYPVFPSCQDRANPVNDTSQMPRNTGLQCKPPEYLIVLTTKHTYIISVSKGLSHV